MLVLLNSAIQNIWGKLSLYMCGRNGLQLNVYLVDDQWSSPEILGPSLGEDEADRGRWRWCDMGRQLPPGRRHCPAGAVSLSTDTWQVPLLSAAVYCKCATSSGAGGWVAQTLWHLCTAIKAECLSCPTRVTRLLLKPFPTPKWGSQSTYAADDGSDDHDIFFTATIFRVEEGSCLMLLLVILVLVA